MPDAGLEPIIVCGPRRSGTTLLSAILCSDPRAHPPQPESQILTKVVEAYVWSVDRFDDFGRPLLGDRESIREVFANACESILDRARAHLSRGGLLVLKHPAFLRVLDPFRDLEVPARIVTIVRDPRDQVASEIEVLRRAEHRTGTLTHRLDRLGARRVRRCATTLMTWFERATTVSDSTVVRYEDLVSDFEASRRALESELGLEILHDPSRDWPEMSGLECFRGRPSWSEKYGRAVDAHGVGRFRRDLGSGEVRAIESICRDLMVRFGYESQETTT